MPIMLFTAVRGIDFLHLAICPPAAKRVPALYNDTKALDIRDCIISLIIWKPLNLGRVILIIPALYVKLLAEKAMGFSVPGQIQYAGGRRAMSKYNSLWDYVQKGGSQPLGLTFEKHGSYNSDGF